MHQDFLARLIALTVTSSAEKSALASTGRLYLALLCALTLSACSTSPNGRTKFVAPAPVSNIYSEVDMQVDLVSLDSDAAECATVRCVPTQAFKQRVEELGARLAQATFGIFPETGERVEQFEFDIANKNKPGSTSNATGRIIIFNGTQALQPDDTALMFLIAREMGRVIGQHHDENSATRILISVVAGVLFPASSLFSTTAVSQTAYSSTLASTAASTATSLVGSKLALDNLKPEQLGEADSIALALLTHIGIKPRDVAVSLARIKEFSGQDAWAQDFYASVKRVQAIKNHVPETQITETAAKAPTATSPHLHESIPMTIQEVKRVALPVNEPYASEEIALQHGEDDAPIPPVVVVIAPAIQPVAETGGGKNTAKAVAKPEQSKKEKIATGKTTKKPPANKPKGSSQDFAE